MNILHGHNGLLFHSETELHSAIQRFMELVSEVVECPGFKPLSRLDLTAHLQVPIRQLILGLMRSKHSAFRGVRKRCRVFSAGWKLIGTGRTLTAYGKAAEFRSRGLLPVGDAARVELSLTGKPLRTMCAAPGTLEAVRGIPLHSLTLDRCGKILWDFLCGFRGGFDFAAHRPANPIQNATGD